MLAAIEARRAPPSAGVAALMRRHPEAFAFWTQRGAGPAPLQDLADALYVLALSGALEEIAPDAPQRYAAVLGGARMPGAITGAAPGAPTLNVHGAAYALGALHLVRKVFANACAEALRPQDWNFAALVDPATLLPRWPWALSHHSWRASHWVGGTPSILASLRRLAPDAYSAHGGPPIDAVLEAIDGVIDPHTGFLKLYASRLLHGAFNAAYAVRHDPVAGEVGGIVHVHWVNHALGRKPYKAAGPLYEAALGLLQKNPRFMEDAPYCLDFDIVQIARTAEPGAPRPPLAARAQRMSADLADFFAAPPPDDYTLHKLPGALATLHECALITGDSVDGLDIAPIDIIAEAYWI
jgi:hypothetical protein